MAQMSARISPRLMFVSSAGLMQRRNRPIRPMKIDIHVSAAIFFFKKMTEKSGTKNI